MTHNFLSLLSNKHIRFARSIDGKITPCRYKGTDVLPLEMDGEYWEDVWFYFEDSLNIKDWAAVSCCLFVTEDARKFIRPLLKFPLSQGMYRFLSQPLTELLPVILEKMGQDSASPARFSLGEQAWQVTDGQAVPVTAPADDQICLEPIQIFEAALVVYGQDGESGRKEVLRQEVVQWVCPVTGMQFVWIPPGEFLMGSPEDEPGRDDDEQQHRVTISKGFYMGKFPVTQAEWKRVMGGPPPELFFENCGDDCPVENVSWEDVQEFIKKLNQQSSEIRFRLPTEAEWEYACRAGTTTAFYNGGITEPDGADPNLDQIGWYDENSKDETHPVGQKKPNAWGLHDMSGNVWEWCQDWYGDYPDGAVVDPEGAGTGSDRVVRGGGWDDSAWGCRSAYRDNGSPSDQYDDGGFRLVLPIGLQVR
ncbi:MAG: hypothetical protein CSB33_01135 [Desulfobacterales bacterium]|nr:MAG: hypothetical protein CSB33_01135 [Desulfobacterales bacterium]